jgi:hypothetical protein
MIFYNDNKCCDSSSVTSKAGKAKRWFKEDWFAGRDGDENICYLQSEGVLCMYA